MKAKVAGTYISFVITLLAILFVIVSFCLKCELLKEIGFSVLGSALVSLIITFSEYFSAKKETLEALYYEAAKYNSLISRIQYYYISEEHNLFLQYLSEKRQNEHAKQFGFQIKKDALKRLVSFYGMDGSDEKVIKAFLLEKENKIKDSIADLSVQVKNAATHGLDALSYSYGKVSFLLDPFKCKAHKKRHLIYSNIYQPLFYIDCFLQGINGDFDRYNRYKQSIMAMAIDAVRKLNEKLFEVETNESLSELKVYSVFYSELDNEIEKLRCLIYRDEKFKPKPKDIVSYLIISSKKPDDEEESHAGQ